LARKRSIRILLIPILAPLFLGWLLAFSGQKKRAPRKSGQKTVKPKESQQEVLEIGVLPEVAPDQELSNPS
jgi:hypothetical protein